MVRSAVAASLVGVAVAGYQCPGGPHVTHAGLRMTSIAEANCDTVKAEMRARVAGENGWFDQHNRGTYTEQNYGGDISFSRLTGDGKYTDKMTFVLTDQGNSCKIEGCSESQVFSIADFSTNYCEQKLLFCGSDEGCNVASNDFTHTEEELKTMAKATTNFGDCLKVTSADDVDSTTTSAADSTSLPRGVDIIIGLADGFFDDHALSDCIEKVSAAVPPVQAAFEELKEALRNKKPLAIVQAIKDVGNALQGVPKELEDCGANLKDVKDLLESLKETVPSLVGEVVSAVRSLKHGDYEDFGEHVGKALREFVPDAHGASALRSPVSGAGSAALDVIIGLADGLFDDHALSECVANALEKAPEAQSALRELEDALKDKSISKIREAINDVVTVAKSIPDSVTPCIQNAKEATGLLPIVEHAIASIVGDIVAAHQSMKAGDYKTFGEDLGRALRILTPRTDAIIV